MYTIPPLLHNDQLIYDNEHKAHAINKYFASISNVDTNNIQIDTHSSDQTHKSPSTLENIEITHQDLHVHDIILTLKIHKPCGIYRWHPPQTITRISHIYFKTTMHHF